jgi:bifunctional DNA-binding transcriptional regulator/antitoxin component of YhaV-PrlF toxin-antitoxin module
LGRIAIAQHLTKPMLGAYTGSIMAAIARKGVPLVVPSAIRRKAGFKGGEDLEFKASGGVITIVRKLPGARDEYSPAQRQIVDARLTEARKGPYFGPFDTADEAIKFIRKEIRNRKAMERK